MCNIRPPEPPSNSSNGHSRKCSSCSADLSEPESYLHKGIHDSCPEVTVVYVKTRKVGYLIGHHGRTIWGFESSSGAKIDILAPNSIDDETPVRVAGSHKNVRMALRMILDLFSLANFSSKNWRGISMLDMDCASPSPSSPSAASDGSGGSGAVSGRGSPILIANEEIIVSNSDGISLRESRVTTKIATQSGSKIILYPTTDEDNSTISVNVIGSVEANAKAIQLILAFIDPTQNQSLAAAAIASENDIAATVTWAPPAAAAATTAASRAATPPGLASSAMTSSRVSAMFFSSATAAAPAAAATVAMVDAAAAADAADALSDGELMDDALAATEPLSPDDSLSGQDMIADVDDYGGIDDDVFSTDKMRMASQEAAAMKNEPMASPEAAFIKNEPIASPETAVIKHEPMASSEASGIKSEPMASPPTETADMMSNGPMQTAGSSGGKTKTPPWRPAPPPPRKRSRTESDISTCAAASTNPFLSSQLRKGSGDVTDANDVNKNRMFTDKIKVNSFKLACLSLQPLCRKYRVSMEIEEIKSFSGKGGGNGHGGVGGGDSGVVGVDQLITISGPEANVSGAKMELMAAEQRPLQEDTDNHQMVMLVPRNSNL